MEINNNKKKRGGKNIRITNTTAAFFFIVNGDQQITFAKIIICFRQPKVTFRSNTETIYKQVSRCRCSGTHTCMAEVLYIAKTNNRQCQPAAKGVKVLEKSFNKINVKHNKVMYMVSFIRISTKCSEN